MVNKRCIRGERRILKEWLILVIVVAFEIEAAQFTRDVPAESFPARVPTI
jgi:hypothetical protein